MNFSFHTFMSYQSASYIIRNTQTTATKLYFRQFNFTTTIIYNSYNNIIFFDIIENNDDDNNNVSYFCVAAGLLYSLLAHYQSTNHASNFFYFVQRCRCVADRFISCFMMMTSLIKIKSEHKNT